MQHPAFAAPRWLSSTHLQTLGAALPLWAPPRTFAPARVERLRIALPSAGALHACAWWHAGTRDTAVVVHGVGGSSESRYVVRAGVALHRAGWHVVRIDLRGAGRSIPDAPELYHAGLSEDLRATIEDLSRRAEVRGIALVGFSLGGHVVWRLAGELAGGRLGALRAAACVSAPLDLAHAVQAIERPRALPYHVYVVRHLVRQARDFARAHPSRAQYDADALRRIRSIRAYDAHVVVPMHGFASTDDYYARASAGPLVARVTLPTLVVHAEDDPMVPAASVRRWLASAGPSVETAWTERGGHVGWFGGLSEASWVDTWAMQRVVSFLALHT